MIPPVTAVPGSFAEYRFGNVRYAIWCDRRGGQWLVDTRGVEGGAVIRAASPSAAVLLGKKIIEEAKKPKTFPEAPKLPPQCPIAIGRIVQVIVSARAPLALPPKNTERFRASGIKSADLRIEKMIARARVALQKLDGPFTKIELSRGMGYVETRGYNAARRLLKTLVARGLVRFVGKRGGIGSRGCSYDLVFEKISEVSS